MTGNVSATYSFAAHAVRVKVDPGTGRVKVLKFVAVHDVGKVINPSGLDGQIHGAKGVSEAGIIPIPAAVANAVADATGARIRSLPISPEKILAAIKTKG